MGNALRRLRGESQKNFAKLLESFAGKYSSWEVWKDFVTMSAISISNAVDALHREQREKQYLACAEKYSEKELAIFPQMLYEVIAELERDPNQGFLGELFMALNLGSEWKGQFFTPYSVCRAMAAMTFSGDTPGRIEQQGWVSVNDPACGAGALLIAFANECAAQKVNYQTSVLFVAQDIDFIAGCMCYIQLSLLGCPGYVVIGDSLCHPATSLDPRGLIPCDNSDVWYTPFYFRPEWHWRRFGAQLNMLCKTAVPLTEAEKPRAEPPRLAEPPLTETEAGQLTLF